MDADTTPQGTTPMEPVATPAPQPTPQTAALGFDTLHRADDLLTEYCQAPLSAPISTGIRLLDAALRGGVHRKKLYVLAGRPREGKSSLALSIGRRMAVEQGAAVLYLSLEMDKQELIERVICQATLTPLPTIEALHQAQTLQPTLARLHRQLHHAWFHIEDLRGAKIGDLDTLWAELKASPEPERKPDVLIIDHIQQVPIPVGLNKADALSTYMTDLKQFAKRNHVAIIACCQINREGKDKPDLAHLKGSGGIEENADVVLICARKPSDSLDLDAQQADCEYDVWLCKHRRGPETKLSLTFRPPCFEFLEPTSYGKPMHPALQTHVEADDDLVTL